jgi:hypothetical protein
MSAFTVTLHTEGNGNDGIRTLRAALKVLLRRFGLRVVKVEETKEEAA